MLQGLLKLYKMSDIKESVADKEDASNSPEKSITTRNVYWSKTIKRIIKDTLCNIDKLNSTYHDIVLESFIDKNKDLIKKSHTLKFIQMKIGHMWQDIIGSVEGITNLGVGDSSGLDIISNYKFKTKFIMELKNACPSTRRTPSTNSYKTDNASSRKENLNKLIKYQQSNNEYAPIYGVVNCNSKMNEGKDHFIEHNGMKVRVLTGNKLLQFIFEDDYKMVVEIFKSEIASILE